MTLKYLWERKEPEEKKLHQIHDKLLKVKRQLQEIESDLSVARRNIPAAEREERKSGIHE